MKVLEIAINQLFNCVYNDYVKSKAFLLQCVDFQGNYCCLRHCRESNCNLKSCCISITVAGLAVALFFLMLLLAVLLNSFFLTS